MTVVPTRTSQLIKIHVGKVRLVNFDSKALQLKLGKHKVDVEIIIRNTQKFQCLQLHTIGTLR